MVRRSMGISYGEDRGRRLGEEEESLGSWEKELDPRRSVPGVPFPTLRGVTERGEREKKGS